MPFFSIIKAFDVASYKGEWEPNNQIYMALLFSFAEHVFF
jgi:hypothetical protein